MAQQEGDASDRQTITNQNAQERLQLDYEQTIAYFNLLSDIRFKLLAFVPTLSGVSVALVSSAKVSQSTALALGILGFFVTLGIIMYELRNTLFYHMSAARAACLERWLGFPRFSPHEKSDQPEPGGMFTEREFEKTQKLVGIIPIAHSGGLALIYGVSLGGWVYIAINSLLPKSEIYVSLLIAAMVAVLTMIQFGVTVYNAHKRARQMVKQCQDKNVKDHNL